MGRAFDAKGNRIVAPGTGGGRGVGTIDNPNTQKFTPTKSWEQMNFGEKLWNTAKEVPQVLYQFIVPPSIREQGSRNVSTTEFVQNILRGTGELGAQITGAVAQGIGGAALAVKQKVTGKPERVEIPYLSDIAKKLGLKEVPTEIASYQEQTNDLKKAGFTEDESKALVGINAYLSLVPFITRGLKTKVAGKVSEVITKREIPISETKAGIIAEKLGRELPEALVVEERPGVTAIKRALGKTGEQKQFADILREHTEKFFEGRESLLSREEPLNKALTKLTDKELNIYSDVTQGLLPKGEITPNLKSAINLWKITNKQIETDLIAKKLLTSEQVENRRWKPIELITGRSRNELQAIGVDPIYYPYLAEFLLRKSDFLGTVGKRTKGGYLKRFTGKLLHDDAYIKNPTISIPRHRLQVFRDSMNAELVDNIKAAFGEKDKEIIKMYRENPNTAELLGIVEWKPSGPIRFFPHKEGGVGVTKRVESYWIPKEVASELNRFFKPGALEKFLRLTYDPLIDIWRVSILNLVPRWVYNNVVGNTMLSVMARTDPVAFAKAVGEFISPRRELPKGLILKEYAGGESPKVGKLGGLKSETTQFLRPVENWLHLLEQAKNYRALRIPAIATQNLIKGWIALGKPVAHLNKVFENFYRMSVYISKTEGKFLGMRLEKPIPPAEGLRYVNEFLGDYSKLTRFERATFRRALPFYNWMKFITTFSFKFPVNHPIRGFVVQALLQDYVDYINEVNQKDDKIKSILRIKTEMVYDGKPVYINVKSAIPFSDVFRTIPTNFETFGRFLTSNPVSKIIIERAFRLNSFTGEPFTQPSQLQQYDEFGKPIRPLPSVLRHIGMQVPQVNTAQQVLDYIHYQTVIKRFETGVPKIYRGQVETADLIMELLKYFGISLSATEFNKIQKNLDKKERKQDVLQRKYERQLEMIEQRL